jgi:hypothetical protein
VPRHKAARQRWGGHHAGGGGGGADQHNFVPFIFDTGGRVNRAGIQFLDLLGVAGLAGAAPVLVDGRPPRFGAVALAHCRKRAALSGVLLELTTQQGFMLAQIVVEIPARDSAAEGVARGARMRWRLAWR